MARSIVRRQLEQRGRLPRWGLALVLALAALAVLAQAASGAGLSGLVALGDAEIRPAFDPSITRYSLQAGEDTRVFTIQATAAGALDTVLVDGRVVGSGVPVSLPPLGMGGAVTVSVTDPSGVSTSYELVYVPDDFPRFETTLLSDRVAPGVLYVSMGRFVAVIDDHGVPYWLKRAAGAVADFKRHPDGRSSYAESAAGLNLWGRPTYEQVILDESFAEIERRTTVGLRHTDLHDFHLLPDGNQLLTAYEGTYRQVRRDGRRRRTFFEDSILQEVTPGGRVVFEWNSWGNVRVRDVPPVVRRFLGPEYAHLNSVALDGDGHLLLSFRGTSQVLKVDRRTGRVLWKLGGESSDFRIVGDPLGAFCGQHDAHRLPNGNLLLFDNGFADPDACPAGLPKRTASRAAEYALDEQGKVARLVWSYDDGTFSRFAGSAQRLENGNTLIGWGGQAGKLATEVTAAGEPVLEIRASAGGENAHSYRVRRFPQTSYPDTSAPANVLSPELLGRVAPGEEVVCTSGEWNVVPAADLTVEWLVDGASAPDQLTGKRANAYRVREPGLGRHLSCRIGATTRAGTALAFGYPDLRAPAVELRARSLTMDRKRRVTLPLRCPLHERRGCTVTVSLRTTRKLRPGDRFTRAHGRTTSLVAPRRLKIGVPGQTRDVRVRLSKRNAALVRRLGRVPVQVLLDARDAAGNTRSTRDSVFLLGPRTGRR